MAGGSQCGQLGRIVSDHILFSFALVISILGQRVTCDSSRVSTIAAFYKYGRLPLNVF